MIEQMIRQAIEDEKDYLLRIARLNKLRMFLDALENEAQRIKKIDLPLWYVQENRSYYGYHTHNGGIESGSWLMIRQDVDPEILEWVNDCCNSCRYLVSGSEGWKGSHPIYHGFCDKMVEIGNKVTPSKLYYKATNLRYSSQSIREGLVKRLGSHTWTQCPRDVNDLPIYR